MTIADKLIKRFEPQLAALLGAVRHLERLLGPEDDWVEDDRRILYEAADRFLRPLGRSTVREKTTRDHCYTADASSDEIEAMLDDAGYQRNLISTRKYRTRTIIEEDGAEKEVRDWAVGSWVLDPTDTDWQHHVFLFDLPDGRTDIYAHEEWSVTEPYEHVTEEQQPGDPNDRLKEILESNDVGYTTINTHE